MSLLDQVLAQFDEIAEKDEIAYESFLADIYSQGEKLLKELNFTVPKFIDFFVDRLSVKASRDELALAWGYDVVKRKPKTPRALDLARFRTLITRQEQWTKELLLEYIQLKDFDTKIAFDVGRRLCPELTLRNAAATMSLEVEKIERHLRQVTVPEAVTTVFDRPLLFSILEKGFMGIISVNQFSALLEFADLKQKVDIRFASLYSANVLLNALGLTPHEVPSEEAVNFACESACYTWATQNNECTKADFGLTFSELYQIVFGKEIYYPWKTRIEDGYEYREVHPIDLYKEMLKAKQEPTLQKQEQKVLAPTVTMEEPAAVSDEDPIDKLLAGGFKSPEEFRAQAAQWGMEEGDINHWIVSYESQTDCVWIQYPDFVTTA